jgi:hypothetical protein
MARKESRRTISLPIELWKAIDEDAERSRRSAVKQMEAVLSTYYGLVEINEPARRVREVFGVIEGGESEAMRQLAPVVARIERGEMTKQEVQPMIDSQEEKPRRTLKIPVGGKAR